MEFKSGQKRNIRRPGTRKRLVIISLCLLFCIIFPVSGDNEFKFRIKIDEDKYDISFKTESEIKDSSCIHLASRFWVYFLFLPGIIVFIILFFNRHKVTAVFIIFSVFLLSGSSDPFPALTVRSAFNNLNNGHYEQALKDFKIAEEFLPCNPALKYNLALCYYLTDNKSYSLCYLRKSITLNPDDVIPRNVLKIIEEKLELASQVPPGINLHPDVPFIFLIIFVNLTLIILGLVYRYKKGGLFIFFVFFVFLSCCSAAVYIYSISQIRQKIGIVAHEDGILKKIPMDIASAWMSFKEGTSLKINGFADGYWLVKSELGFEGFIREADLIIVQE